MRGRGVEGEAVVEEGVDGGMGGDNETDETT